MALIWQGLLAGVTCKSLGVNEDPLNGFPIFLAQLQVDLTGAVSLGPVRSPRIGKRVKQNEGDLFVRSQTQLCLSEAAVCIGL